MSVLKIIPLLQLIVVGPHLVINFMTDGGAHEMEKAKWYFAFAAAVNTIEGKLHFLLPMTK